MLHQEKPSGRMENDEDLTLKEHKTESIVIEFLILLTPRLDKNRQDKDMGEDKMEADRTEEWGW